MAYLRYWIAALLIVLIGAVPRRRATPPDISKPPVQLRLLFAGDVMQHQPQITAARTTDGFDYAPVFGALRPHFDSADWVVVNLETTLTRTEPYTGYPRFRSPVALVDALRDAGDRKSVV